MEKEKNTKPFASVKPDIVDRFLVDAEKFRAGEIEPDEPHYDDKALTLFLLLRFHANCSLEFYTNETMLCELMGLSTRAENKASIMSNILMMDGEDLISIRRKPGSKFFYIVLDANTFIADKGFVRIYKEEFEQLLPDKNKDKLLLLLYAVKRFQHQSTEISFPSIETLMSTVNISKPTVCKGLQRLAAMFHVYKARINFYDGTYKDINYYKSRSEKEDISSQAIEDIVRQYYSNVKSITERE